MTSVFRMRCSDCHGFGPLSINTRLAYVAVSRAEHDVRVYTNDAEGLGARLATDVHKTSAVNFRKSSGPAPQTNTAAPEPALQKSTVVRVREYADPNHRTAAVALAYAEQPSDTVVLAKDPTERRELNQLIRADLQTAGSLHRIAKPLRFTFKRVDEPQGGRTVQHRRHHPVPARQAQLLRGFRTIAPPWSLPPTPGPTRSPSGPLTVTRWSTVRTSQRP